MQTSRTLVPETLTDEDPTPFRFRVVVQEATGSEAQPGSDALEERAVPA